jgi:hypothetical protein
MNTFLFDYSIDEIISRPFLGIRKGGSNKTSKKRETDKNIENNFMQKYISLEDFLKIFESRQKYTLQEFLAKAVVKVGDKTTPLKQYMKDKNINKSDIHLLFENIQARNEYLTRFYTMSLRVNKDHLKITEEAMKNKEMNNNRLVTYKNVIRNMHYKDILENTLSGLENVPSYFAVVKDLYLNCIIDYKILTPSAIHYMKLGRLGSVFSSFYFRASIMNPYLVYSLNHSVLKGTKIFTPTLGWTSYCFGFLECPYVEEYVGTDVISSVCKKTKQFAKERYPNKTVEIFCQPSEDLFVSEQFKKKYREHFDVVFFSPPYYKLELYQSKNQSTSRYKTYEEWLDKYWDKTIQLCSYVLSKKGKLCYILSGYGSENTKDNYDLLEDMNTITKKYFRLTSQQPMYNKDVHSTNHKETSEQIMIFSKS